MEEETIIITKKVYDYLCERDEWLSYLEAAGVDNWTGYGDAREMQENKDLEVK